MVTRMGRSWLACLAIAAVLGSCALAACTGPKNVTGSANPDLASLTGIHKIRHVIIIMQENRTFDNYFGTFPGADGIPPGTCLPRMPGSSECVAPFHMPNIIPLCDRFFSSQMGESLTNHLYMVAAQSGGLIHGLDSVEEAEEIHDGHDDAG